MSWCQRSVPRLRGCLSAPGMCRTGQRGADGAAVGRECRRAGRAGAHARRVRVRRARAHPRARQGSGRVGARVELGVGGRAHGGPRVARIHVYIHVCMYVCMYVCLMLGNGRVIIDIISFWVLLTKRFAIASFYSFFHSF